MRWFFRVVGVAIVIAFSLPAPASVQRVLDVHVATLDSDPNPDLIVCDGDATTPDGVWIWIQHATKGGEFGTGRKLPGVAAESFAQAVSADLNGDGRTDVVAISSDSTSGSGVRVWTQKSTPPPACSKSPCPPEFVDRSMSSGLPTIGAFRSIALGDVDDDGKTDVVLAGEPTSNPGIQVWVGSGTGSFRRTATLSPVAGNQDFTTVLVADLNGDGLLDTTVCRRSMSGSVLTASGHGDGTFGGMSVVAGTTGYFTNGMLVADLNGDAAADLIVATKQAGIRIFDRSGGSWQEVCQGGPCGGAGTRLGDSSTNYTDVQSGDFDNDGHFDLVVTSDGSGGGLSQAGLLQGAGTFSFPTAEQPLMTGTMAMVELRDTNLDGTLDVVGADTSVVAGPTGASARVLWNQKFELTAPAAAACVPLRGNPPMPYPTFIFKSLTHQEDALRYRVEIDGTPAFRTIPLAATLDQVADATPWTASSYAPGVNAQVSKALSGLTPGSIYYWRTMAYVRGRRSPASTSGLLAAARSFTVDLAGPKAVQNLTMKTGGACGGTLPLDFAWDQVTLNTLDLPETITYRLYSSSDPSAAFPSGWTLVQGSIAQDPTPSTCSDEAGAGIRYYQVRAVDTCGSEGL